MRPTLPSLLLTIIALSGSSAGFCDGDKYAGVRDKLATCVACHGEQGASPIQPQYPILAGQHLHYVYVQLKDFKSGLREGAIMGPIAGALEKEEMLKIAEYFSEQRWPTNEHNAAPESEGVGLTVINAGQCVACHLGGFEGNSRVPRLAGQRIEYLSKTMQDFKHKTRNNSPAKGSLFASFSDEDLDGVADHLAGLKGQD